MYLKEGGVPDSRRLLFCYRPTGFAIRLFVYIPADCKSAGTGIPFGLSSVVRLPVAVPSGFLTRSRF